MQRQVVRLTRQELYEKIWSRPVISLGEELGISGRGLGKICTRFEIPVPPRGYWAKLAAGKHVVRIPLPTAESGVGSVGLENEPTRRIQPSNRRLRLSLRIPHCTNGAIAIDEPVVGFATKNSI